MKINEKNPAIVFANSLSSKKSSKITLRVINYLCKIINNSNHLTFNWSKISYSQIIELRKKLVDKELKAKSINSYISTMKSVSREAWRIEIINIDTYMRIKDIQQIKGNSESTGKALSSHEINKILNFKSNKIIDIRDSAIIAVGYGAGLRCFELAKIKYNDINENQIYINGKNRIERTVYLPKPALKKLNEWLKIRGSHKGSIFCAMLKNEKISERQLSNRRIAEIIDKRCKKIGIDRFTPHDLRRSFATNLLENGVDVFTVQKLMRHANINTTIIYDKRSEKTAKEAIELLPF
ncbi:MAG: site-specific integrase [Colwellia sp.]